jgi:hypothetical protein
MRVRVLTLSHTPMRSVPLRPGRRLYGARRFTKWLYRPGLGWERVARRGGQADVDAAGDVEVLLGDDPALVPLETLPGRNHYEFPAGERPPWQWRVRGLYPGWSS